MIYWLYLLLAITAEVIGTLSMKYASVTGEFLGHIIMYIMISCSYFLLSKAVQQIALGIAYALWEAIGVVFITFFSVLWFDEPISLIKIGGLLLLFVGIFLLKSGSKSKFDQGGELYATA